MNARPGNQLSNIDLIKPTPKLLGDYYKSLRSHADIVQAPPSFEKNVQGAIKQCKGNVIIAFNHANISFAYDKFTRNYQIRGGDRRLNLDRNADGISDENIIRLETYIREAYKWEPKDHLVYKTAKEVGLKNEFDSVLEWLKSLHWDKNPRLNTWLPKYANTEDNEFTRQAGRNFLLGLVMRQFKPGAKFDWMIVLIGEQGVGKSTLIKSLVPEEWYTDSSILAANSSKEILEITSGRLIIENGEMVGLNKKAVENIKAEISRTQDEARLAYAREPTVRPRRFLLAGTTNNQQFLTDETGNRRFWPIKIQGKCDFDGLISDRDQLLAEAVYKYKELLKQNESQSLNLDLSPEALKIANRYQSESTYMDPHLYDVIANIEPLAEDEYNFFGYPVVTNQALASALDLPKCPSGKEGARIKSSMLKFGWKYKRGIKFKGRSRTIYIWKNKWGDHPNRWSHLANNTSI